MSCEVTPSLFSQQQALDDQCTHGTAFLQGAWNGEAPDDGSTQGASSSSCMDSRAIRPRDLEAAKELQGMGLASPGAHGIAADSV